MAQKDKTRQRRKSCNRCAREIEAEIDTARTSGDLAKADLLKKRLANLRERWSLGLSSHKAKVISREPAPTYFAR